LVPSKVLVPVDGSPASLRALDSAIEMMGQHSDTSLVLLNVQKLASLIDQTYALLAEGRLQEGTKGFDARPN